MGQSPKQKNRWKIEAVASPGDDLQDGSRGISRKHDVAGANALGHTKEEQTRIGVELLRRAFGLLRREGWRKPSADPHVEPDGPGLTVLEALGESSDGEHLGIDVHYARRLLERIQWPVWKWEAKPLVAERDVICLFQAAISAVGYEPPAARRLGPGRRGGWVVTHGRIDAPRVLAALRVRAPRDPAERLRRVVAFVSDGESARLLPDADRILRATGGVSPSAARRAGLISRTPRGRYQLTDEGRAMAEEMERERRSA